MTTLVKIHRKGQMTVLRGKIVLTPKVMIDRSKFPNADDDYTPAQRRFVDARLHKADVDIQRGRTYGPFHTAEEMAASIETNIKKLRTAKRKAKSA